MKRFKDWELGEYRITVNFVTPKGNTLEYYLPHISEKQGDTLLKAVTKVFVADKNKSKRLTNG